MTELELYDTLTEALDVRNIMKASKAGQRTYSRKYGIAVVAKDIIRNSEWPGVTMLAGQKVRVTYASRMGDLCLSADLQREFGYETRGLQPGEGFLTDIELHSFEEKIS